MKLELMGLVVGQQEASFGGEATVNLPERSLGIGHMVEHHVRHHGIRLSIAKREVLQAAEAKLDLELALILGATTSDIQHLACPIDADDAPRASSQERQQPSGPGAEIDDGAVLGTIFSQQFDDERMMPVGTFDLIALGIGSLRHRAEELLGLLATTAQAGLDTSIIRSSQRKRIGGELIGETRKETGTGFTFPESSQPIVDPGTLAPWAYKPRIRQDTQMPRHPALSHGEDRDQLVPVIRILRIRRRVSSARALTVDRQLCMALLYQDILI